MKFLLVMPRFVDRVGEWYNFPVGIPYVSASLKAAGIDLVTLNLNSRVGDVEDIIQHTVKETGVDVVMTGGLSFQYNSIRVILKTAKEIDQNLVTVAGGGIITSAPIPGMKVLEYADYGIIGEGEITTTELCHALEAGKSPASVKGIIYKHNDSYHYTAPRPEIADLDSLPFPDYEGFDYGDIAKIPQSFSGMNEDHAITMTTSRSCPFQCTFCFHSSGSHYRRRSFDNFFQEVDLLVEKFDIKYIFISDELFAVNFDRVKEFCARIKPYNIRWSAQFRVCDVNEEMVRLLKDANCTVMSFGLESADNGILKSMNKHITIEQSEKALKLAYDYGITPWGNFIFGDPEETIETAKKTLAWWKKHPEYGITLNFITTYPGTPLYRLALKRGIIKDEVAFIKAGCPVVNLSKMSKKELAWLTEQVVTLPLRAFLPPENVHDLSVDYTQDTFDFKGTCSECGSENQWHGIHLFVRNTLSCKKCGKKHRLPFPSIVVKSIDKFAHKLLDEHKKIAFWGINDYFATMIPMLSMMKEPGVYLIDNSHIKQGAIIEELTIQSPDILVEEQIDTVIIPVIQFYPMIERQILDDYPHVKSIINIVNLVRPEQETRA